MINYITEFISDFIGILNEMSPYLLLGFFFAGLLKIAFPQSFIDKYLGKKNTKSVLYAALLGIPLPLCSCGVIPTGMSFYKNGASKGASVSFLISTPQTGVDSILVTYSLLGLPFAIIRPIAALITGIFGGAVTNKFDHTISDNTNAANENSSCSVPQKKHSKLYIMFKYAFVDFLQDISKWLIIGLLLAAFISVVIPDDFFTQYISSDLFGILIILLASIPLYICATSSVPIAAVLLMKGLSPGAALVFLMAGPATNAATITVLNKVLGKKTMWFYLISIVSGAVLFGLFIDSFLPREWFSLGALAQQVTGHHAHWHMPEWLQWGSSILLLLLILNGYIQKYIHQNREIKKKNDMNEKVITVNGMNCNHCKNNVEKNLSALENIEFVEVNLEQKKVFIKGKNINLDVIKNTVNGLGYEYVG